MFFLKYRKEKILSIIRKFRECPFDLLCVKCSLLLNSNAVTAYPAMLLSTLHVMIVSARQQFSYIHLLTDFQHAYENHRPPQ